MSEIRKNIAELPQQVADKIAAGEVIERPLSIVKELVENSVDAGAKSIAVEIKNGGKSYIRVTDDGCGIVPNEVELAFKRHATSKLRTAKDLDSIETLGFRGEALASISAVSRTELITKTEDEEAGVSITIEGGNVAALTETGCPTGTTIIVRDLFYNTPARMKFLKKDNTESAQIIDFVSKMALAYPNIRVKLINNSNVLFSTPGRGDRFTAIATVFDPHTAKKLIKIDASGENDLYIEGYISPPSETRANRKGQIFFVNGRYIQNKLLDECVSDGYREKMFEGRYPVAFLFLHVNPELIDVNIHPNKKEIRFDNDEPIREFVTTAIRNGLKVREAVPDIVFKQDRQADGGNENIGGEKKSYQFPKQNQEQIDIRKILREKRAEEESAFYSAEKADDGSRKDRMQYIEEKAENESKNDNDVIVNINGKLSNDIKTKGSFIPEIKRAELKPFEVAELRPIGTLFASYILASDDQAFYMIDQHAAHERIFYEQLTKSFYGQQTVSQIIGIPISLEVSYMVKNAEAEWIDFIRKIGFAIEEFGPKSYAVKEIPMYMELSEAESFLNDFFDSLEEMKSFKDVKRAEKIILKACKSAVKANNLLDMNEVNRLITDLSKTENPFSCPHGRPTIIKMTKREIETLFKR
ncbi:MAG: DNA mismatch repair endonuclease MutL [Firmicutes bacterium]|nr:DNA mismatch repair endonuclease MutL [Bacillota bacterium]